MENDKLSVSYSQYSKWRYCPWHFYLDYVKGLRKFEGSINTAFGTAIHETFQLYVETLYTKGTAAADALNLKQTFQSAFKRELDGTDNPDNKVKYTDDEYVEFSWDGEDLIEEFLKTSNRIKHFPSDGYEFIGVEVPLETSVKNDIRFIAYVDLILKNKKTGVYKIFDFKTSFNGWNKDVKSDIVKVSQLLLYKIFYSKIFNVPLHMIDVEFFILKRRLYENVSYPQSRLQNFIPDNSKQEITDTINDFIEFIDTCFTPDGKYNESANYFKNPGKNKKNCKYCSHYKTVNCNGKAD